MDETSFFKQIAARDLSGAYLLFGEESFSRQMAVEKAIQTMDEAARELNVERLVSPLSHQVVNACETLPFFSDRRMVIVTELPTEEATALADYVTKISPTTLLLIIYRGKPNVQGALYKALHKLDRTVEFAAYDNGKAEAFLNKRAGERGCLLERGVAQAILQRVGNDLGTLQNTVFRLCDYAGDHRTITLSHVNVCVPPSSDETVFTILDNLVSGNMKKAMGGLMELLQSGSDTSMRLSSFFEGRIRQMFMAKQLLSHGMSDSAVISAIGGSPYAAKKTVQNAKKCTLSQLSSAMEAFAGVDYQQKQGLMKDDDALLLALFHNF